MTIQELERLDRLYQEHLQRQAVADVLRAIDLRRAQHGRTDALERQLATLTR